MDEAVRNALAQLGVPREQVRVEVLEEGSKGLFGLIGGREARVRVVWQPSKAEAAAEWMRRVTAAMDLHPEIAVRAADEYVLVDVAGPELGALIGRHGKTLDALQYLLNLATAKVSDEPTRVVLDVGGYRARRAEVLQRIARRAAERVERSGRRVELEPMSAVERRVVHLALQGHPEVVTRSEGEGPYRRVIIERRS